MLDEMLKESIGSSSIAKCRNIAVVIDFSRLNSIVLDYQDALEIIHFPLYTLSVLDD